MKKRVLCCAGVLLLVLAYVLPTFALAVEEQQLSTESTEASTEATNEPTTESTTEPTTEPTREPTTEPPTQPATVHEGTCGAGTRWQFDEISGVLTISGSGAISFNKAPWLEYRRDITSIVIQPGITTIGNEAFSVCSYVTSVSIPSTVTKIEKKAFYACSRLTSINLPSSVTYLGDSAFSSCSSLKNVNLPQSVTDLGVAIFDLCPRLTTVSIPSSWTKIPASMFSGCGLTEITIPGNVKSIGSMAFSNCSALTIIRFKGNAPDIHQYAFNNVKSSVLYPATNSTWTVDKQQKYGGDLTWSPEGGSGIQISGTFGKSNNMEWRIEGTTLYITGDGIMNGWGIQEKPPWYDYRGHIKKIVMSGNMQNIYTGAFSGCVKLTEIVWPTGLTTIYSTAFSDCSSLKEVVIPGSVQSISADAFRQCTSLTSITLPQSLIQIGSSAFSKCTSLQSITIPSKVKEVHNTAFANCTALKTIYFTGKLPQFTDKGVGYNGTFGYLSNVTVYYPANNSSWTAAKVQALNQHYASQPVMFVPDNGKTPVQPTEPEGSGAIVDSTDPKVDTGSGRVPSEPEETKIDTSEQTELVTNTDSVAEQTDPVTTTDAVAEQTDPVTTTDSAAEEIFSDLSDSQKIEDQTKPATQRQSENTPNSDGWVIAVISVVAVIIAVGTVIWKKKKLNK